MNLAHLIFRQRRQRPWRTALSIASVAIAAAAVLGITLAQASVRMGYRKLLDVAGGRAALEIVAAGGGRFSPAGLPSLDNFPHTDSVTPLVTRATLARVNRQRFRSVILGVPPDAAGIWQQLPITAGKPCRQPGEALISAELAKSLKFNLGDRLIVLAARGSRAAKIVGMVDSASLREFAPAATLVMPLATVQEQFGLGDAIDRVRVVLAPDAVREDVQAALAARVPHELIVQAPLAQLELAGGILRSTELALQFAGALSMAMAVFIVLNTMRMNFGERRRDMAVLRVLGVTSRQLVGLQLAEGLALGLFGAIIGMPLGLALGRGLAAVMQSLAETNAGQPETPYWTLLVALVAGPLVAGIAALVPALQSRGVSPLEALGDSETRRGERLPRWSIVGGLVAWSLAVALLILVALDRLAPDAAIPAGVLMLVGFIAVIPVLLRPVVRLTARLLSPWLRTEGEFAAGQLLVRPTRTGLTVGVLVVAISTGIGLGNAVINNVEDVRGWYRRLTDGDIMLAAPPAAEGATENTADKVRESILAQPGVARVVETRYVPARCGNIPAMCIIHDLDASPTLPWAVSDDEDQRLRQRLSAGEIVVGSSLAQRLQLAQGDELRLELQGRAVTVHVAGVVRDYALGGLSVFLDSKAAPKLVELGPPQFYTVHVQPGTPIAPLVERLRGLLESEGLVIESYEKVRGQLDLLIGGVVGALWGLLSVAFIVGGLAVGNTLSMGVLEQTHELGLMRIVGMTRRQIRKLILCESLLLGILGALMGIAAGVTTAWVIHLCNEPLLGYSVPFSLRPWLVVANAGSCLAITLAAAWLPAARAVRLNLLTAIAYE